MTDPELLEEVRRPAIGVFPMDAWDPSDASYHRPLQVPVESSRLLNE